MNSPTKVSYSLLFAAALVILSASGSLKSVSAQTTTISPVSGPFSLQQINGHKVIATSSGLHAVFSDGSNINYSTSATGGSWSTPFTIASFATSHPTIAAAGNTVGIAYVSNGTIYYRHKLSNGSWSSPLSISGGDEPAMVGYGSMMYLTWISGSIVKFASFAANSTSSPTSQSVGTSVNCTGSTSHKHQPAIAVIPTSSTNSAPLVRVAFFYSFQAGNIMCAFPRFLKLEVHQKTTGNWTLLTSLLFTSLQNSSATSLTMAANSSTGDFYLATSYVVNGMGTTKLFNQNAWNNGTWGSVQIVPRKSLIDVAAVGCGKFRIALSDFTMGNGTYGPTWYRTGLWSGTATPGWVESTGVQVSPFARDPQALLWTGHFGLASNRDVHAMYDELSGGSYFVRHDAYVFNGQQLPDCRIRNLGDEKRGAVALDRKPKTGDQACDYAICLTLNGDNFGRCLCGEWMRSRGESPRS